MPRLTKEDKVRKFYYHLNRFNDSMKQHTEYAKTILVCTSRRKTIEQNEQGLMREDVKKGVDEWTVHLERTEKLLANEMQVAMDSYDFLKKDLK